jgi:O-antigen ligase
MTTWIKHSLVYLLATVFFALILLLTLVPGFSGDNYNQVRLFWVGLLAVVAPLSLLLAAPFAVFRQGLLWAGSWTLALLLSAVLYPNNAVTWLEPFQYAAFFIAVVCFGTWLASKTSLPLLCLQVVYALALVAFIYAVGCLYVYFFALADGNAINDDLLPWGFINIRYWSQIASWTVPLLPVAVLAGPLKQYASWRYMLYFTLAIWFWLLLLSTARGSLLALSVSFVFTLVLFRKAAWPWAKVLLATALAGAVLWLLLTNWLPEWLFGQDQVRAFSSTSSGRWPLWQEAWAMSLQHFPLGMGPFSWVSHAFLTPVMQESARFGHPHNMLLFWAAEYGWLAILPLLGLVWHAAKQVRRIQLAQQTSLPLIAFVASAVAALVHSCFSAVFITPHSLLMGLLVMSLCWALLHQHTTAPVASNWSRRIIYVAAFAMLLWAGLWLQQVARYTQSYYYVANHPSMSLNGINFPRFFEHSYIPNKDAP